LESQSEKLDLSLYPTKPTQIVSASTGWLSVNLGEVLQSHELLLSLAGRDLRARYKQTILGIAWVVMQPLFAAGIFSFVLNIVAGLESPDGMPYFLFTFTGLVAWNGFGAVLSRSSGALVGNAALVTKIYFPRLVLPLATVLTVLVDFLVALSLLALLTAALWHLPGWTVLLMPVFILLLWVLALGVGLCVAAVAVSYRDALYVLPVVTQFLMWSSAVIFPTERVPERFLTILYLNPVVSLVEAFRWSVLGSGTVRWEYVAYSAFVTVLVFICGSLAFRRMERRFADVI
jgi:lipopolysaccharide transport system permease protein